MKRIDKKTKQSLVLDYSKYNDLSNTFKCLFHGAPHYKKNELKKAFTTILCYLWTRKEDKEKIKQISFYLSPQFYVKKNLHELFPDSNDGWCLLLKNHPYITYDRMLKIINVLQKANIIKVEKGYCTLSRKVDGKYEQDGPGKMTTIYLLPNTEWGIKLNKKDNAGLVYAQIFNISAKDNTKNKATLIDKSLTAAGLPTNTKGQSRNYYKTTILDKNHPEQLKLDSHNELYKGAHSIFRCDRHFGTMTELYGRYYGIYSRIPKHIRKIIQEHDKYIELDFNQFIINCFYMIETGKKCKEDVYKRLLRYLDPLLDKNDYYVRQYRNIMKPLCILLFNGHGKEAVIYSINKELHKLKLHKKTQISDILIREKHSIPNDVPIFKFDANDIIEGAKKAFPEISTYLFKINSEWTQFIESEVIRKLFIAAKKNGSIFSVHDAIAVPIHLANKFNKLKEYFLKKTISQYKTKLKTKNNHIVNIIKNNTKFLKYQPLIILLKNKVYKCIETKLYNNIFIYKLIADLTNNSSERFTFYKKINFST